MICSAERRSKEMTTKTEGIRNDQSISMHKIKVRDKKSRIEEHDSKEGKNKQYSMAENRKNETV